MMKPEEFTAEEIIRYMDLAIEACRPSDIIGSHGKSEVLALLEYLRDKEALVRVQQAAYSKDWRWDQPAKIHTA